MAKIFKPSNKKRQHQSKAKQLAYFESKVTSYDPKGKGISSHADGRICFVSGAMLDEVVNIKPLKHTKTIIEGETIAVSQPNPSRVKPSCQHFGECGGCQLQYMDNQHQVTAKKMAIEHLFNKQLNTQIPWQPIIDSEPWQYRRAAKIAVWHPNENQITLGFRQAKSKLIVDLAQCPILAQPIIDLLHKLKPVLLKLDSKKHLTHIRTFALNSETVLVLRFMADLTQQDQEQLISFAKLHDVSIILEQEKGQFVNLLRQQQGIGTLLEYKANDCRYQFQPDNFIQVNAKVNELMVSQALNWLELTSNDVVLDLFAGVGNFSIPLAKKAKQVFAVEGVNEMVKRLKANATLNNLDNVLAYQADLSQISDKSKPKWLQPIDKLLLDPARDGAFEVVKKIPLLAPKSILYVSCEPTTMVRDLKELQKANYKLTKFALLNMFPQTSHIEAMALLTK